MLSLVKSIVFFAATHSQGQAAPTVRADAGDLITKVMSRYFSAPSLSAKVRLTQEAKGVSVTVDSVLQFDQPDKVYFHQERTGKTSESFTLVSDGVQFSYDRPGEALGPGRFVEYTRQNGRRLTYRDMYAAVLRSVIDRSPAVELLLARHEDLSDLRSRLGTKAVTGETEVGGKRAFVIEGLWHDMPGEPATGKFRMVVSGEGDLYRFVRVQRYSVPDKLKEVFTITSTWDVNAEVGIKTDAALYQIR